MTLRCPSFHLRRLLRARITYTGPQTENKSYTICHTPIFIITGMNSFESNIKHTELNLLFLSKRVEEVLRGDYTQ